MKDTTSDEEVDARVARIAGAISEALSGHVGQRAVTEETLASVCAVLHQIAPHEDSEHLRFMVGSNPDEVVPSNLYTAMRMTYGVHAPSWSECEGGTWTAPDGTCYEWRDGVTYATFPKPLLFLNITLQVEGDEKHG